MLPPGFENSGLKVGARNREAALRLTSNERLLDFFEDADYKCFITPYATNDLQSRRAGGRTDLKRSVLRFTNLAGVVVGRCSRCVKKGCS